MNLLICFPSIPLFAFEVLAVTKGHVIPEALCRFTQALYTVLTKVINWSDAGLALNRCIALFLPYHYKRCTTRPVLAGMLIFSWSVSMFVVASMEAGLDGMDTVLPIGQCAYISRGGLGLFYTVLALALYSLAGVGALLILGKNIRVLMNNRVTYNNERRNVENLWKRVQLKRRLKLAQVLLGMFLWSAVCIMPWGIITVNFPSMFAKEQVSVFWLRTSFASQYAFTPVWLQFCLQSITTSFLWGIRWYQLIYSSWKARIHRRSLTTLMNW